MSAAWRKRGRLRQALQQPHYLPVRGILAGALTGATFLTANKLFKDDSLALLLSMVAGLASTKAMYERELTLFFESFAGRGVGILAVLVSLAMRYQALLLIPVRLVPSVFIAGQAFSRYSSGSFLFTHSQIVQRGNSFVQCPPSALLDTKKFIIMTALGMTPLLLIGSLSLLLFIPLLWLARNTFSLWFLRRLGGHTNDCLGATQQIVEVLFYLLVVIACLYPLSPG